MNGYEEKIKDCLFLEVCNAAGREEWDGLAHQQKENLMLVCRLSGYDEKFQRDCGLVTREQMEHWGIEEEVLFQDAWANMFAKRPPVRRKAGWKSDRPSGIHPRCVSYGGEGRSGHGTAEGWGIWSKQGVPGDRLSVR